ncbi:Ribosomal RNA large subunit methyltransferase E [Piscirickettsia salmonis]|uniref:23S rRNA (uridine(2552)-2'-O)-methyltransferase RlmE n=1 Tax=Piscirickettsia salmonis TaxID=1238 RepID=UPI0012B99B4A|nr:23S rRNA (uridine(2552)-2'-O)-methyltransferase RlmE [Piscirickettsia salmonis]QGP48815.1 Ribosomal RNA large subunit methyltransferase E [Piscirickettsia salmonis]QGP56450.1 Ribosomal RNA large subunit methyltransferase E [Piscirickettsia salmonis]QGP57690.1 Ribosomal RNA large subunit methyltransferase E [Piscirickettsia salmonis]QGP66015.1 Ribosomal RNA large subunit methyltransferase E [Piscirickettsia salmonis]
MAKKSKSSSRWLQEHRDDFYVQKARAEGYRSRASYKLKEVQEKDKIIRRGMTVIDLGAAPGGWSQLAADWAGASGCVIGLDLLPMDPLENVIALQGDFTEKAVYDRLVATLADRPVDIVLSDMAPNMSGIDTSDQAQAMYLVELALYFAEQTLRPGGDLLVKVFQGVGSQEYIKALRAKFTKVVTRKPAASRPRSREIYLLARNFQMV